jgi:hypothetical protein
MATVSRRRGKWVADYRDGTGRRHWEIYKTRRAAAPSSAIRRNARANKGGRVQRKERGSNPLQRRKLACVNLGAIVLLETKQEKPIDLQDCCLE